MPECCHGEGDKYETQEESEEIVGETLPWDLCEVVGQTAGVSDDQILVEVRELAVETVHLELDVLSELHQGRAEISCLSYVDHLVLQPSLQVPPSLAPDLL